ncbi:MAG: hypothetical protein KatS3mg010_1742 [Acidimicrobiia bacterium]|nr:MAG: hypothetical protein KatS3mg010_1742 [Acidimicrobiia bacterium]
MAARSAPARAGDNCHVCGADVTQGWSEAVDAGEATCVACGAPSTAVLGAARHDGRLPTELATRGDRRVAYILERAAWKGVVALHDLRVPKSRTVLHDVAIASSGVYVVDAKAERGIVEERLVRNGSGRERCLYVSGRNRARWFDATQRQVDAVRAVLDARIPVRGVVCVLDAEWSIAPRPLVFGQVVVVWPRALARLVSRPGPLSPAAVQRTAERVAKAFPRA